MFSVSHSDFTCILVFMLQKWQQVNVNQSICCIKRYRKMHFDCKRMQIEFCKQNARPPATKLIHDSLAKLQNRTMN